MARKKPLVSESRHYLVTTVSQAKQIATAWLEALDLSKVTKLGLPEVDDRYHFWRVPIRNQHHKQKIGEIVIDAFSTEVLEDKSTKPIMIEARLLEKDEEKVRLKSQRSVEYPLSPLRNTIGLGDCVNLISDMPSTSVDLIFTSPPYFNARPEYSDYQEYDQYLQKMRQVIRGCHRILNEGRFFVINTSPVLLRRASRNESSRRIAVPFDLHRIFTEEGYDFIDDIIWVKPEGAGWATGRGRRFAADRNPLQYKAVPVTEYVLVYRKRTDILIDWYIRNHPDRNIIKESKIGDDYERTNIWRIMPKTNSYHPAAFPIELAKKVISYYSFKGDVVLDPFAGSGTVGQAAATLGRRFVLLDNNVEYVNKMQENAPSWFRTGQPDLLFINHTPAQQITQPFLPLV